MKLFIIEYIQADSEDYYLTIGEDEDTASYIRERELNKLQDPSWLYSFNACEVLEVNGHKILVE